MNKYFNSAGIARITMTQNRIPIQPNPIPQPMLSLMFMLPPV